jgi:hypothetical protein
MNFLQKLRFLFSRSDDLSWLKDLDDSDRMARRLLALVDERPAPAWTETIKIRTQYDDRPPTLTISQVHAELSKAIEEGYGALALSITVAYQEGLLCGQPAVRVSGATHFSGRLANIYGPLHLETDCSVVMLDQSTFLTAMKHTELQGPYT